MSRRNKVIVLFIFALLFFGIFAIGFRYGQESDFVPDEEIEEQDYAIPYTTIFQEQASKIDWDWQLLAAVCYEESHFNPSARSSSGALGLMQLMPQTAYKFGLNDSTILIPEYNIAAGTDYIKRLQEIFSFISNKEEQTKFVLASYNAGPAHIMDARRLAKRYGRSAYIWTDHTEYWLTQLRNEVYQNDSVVLYGSCNAEETTVYVRKVLRTYHRFLEIEP